MKFTEEELEKIKKERMEQIDRWLDNEYGCSYTRLEELHDFVIEQDMKHQEEKDKEIEKLKRHIEAINRWIDSNIEAGNIYCYDTTPFPKLEDKK